MLCDGIINPDPTSQQTFQKNILPRKKIYINYQQLPIVSFKTTIISWWISSFQYVYTSIYFYCPYWKNICCRCQSSREKFIQEEVHIVVNLNQPTKQNEPTKFTLHEEVQLISQKQGLWCWNKNLKKMRSPLDKHGEAVDPQFKEDFVTLFSGWDKSILGRTARIHSSFMFI